MKNLKYLLASFIVLISFSISGANPDPGIRDTVTLSGGPLVVDQSHPITVAIANDYDIGSYSLTFSATSLDGGFATFDSAVYVGRMADPAIFSYRTVQPRDNNGTPPDTLLLGGAALGLSLKLPPGSGAVLELYYTGLSAGQMKFDSIFLPPAAPFLLVDAAGTSYYPEYVTSAITIDEGSPAPKIYTSDESVQMLATDNESITVWANSPVGYPITLELYSFTGFDDETDTPTATPTFGSGNPATFSWTPSSSDVGIWEATFRACDSAGICSFISTDIQVVADSSFMLAFDYTETTNSTDVTGMMHGNFDSDLNPELFASGSCYFDTYTFELYDYQGYSGFQRVLADEGMHPSVSPAIGFFDNDAYLDAVLTQLTPPNAITVLYGNGNNGFTSTSTDDIGSVRPRGATVGEFTRDAYVDYVAVQPEEVSIYSGATNPIFQKVASFPTIGSGMSINSADFNGDGYDDLAVGTAAGIHIYLGTSGGGFTAGSFYSQAYGSLDIEITNEGSDFNNDGYYDLCISTPSVGGEFSDMVVYLGNGDGTFNQSTIRTVKGQIFGNNVGDINNDGDLDIICVNGALEYAAILFGDGDGNFTNELRFDIPFRNPMYMDCFDADLDGDLDVVVNANAFYPTNSLFLLSNQLDPQMFESRSFNITGCNNAQIELVSEGGKVFNTIRNTMPTGQYFQRNIDDDGIIDGYAELAMVEEGQYLLTATRKPNLAPGELFTVEFTLDGELYRLAKDIPMSAENYQFTVYAAEATAVYPRPGKFVEANPPSFMWEGEGDFDFQLSSDIEFETILYDVDVSGSSFSLPEALSLAETDIFYWRVRQDGDASYDCLYAVNIVSGSSGSCGDANSDAQTNVADVVFLINMIFKGGPEPDPYCIGDANGDGTTDVGDAVFLINYVFKGGSAPTDSCCP